MCDGRGQSLDCQCTNLHRHHALRDQSLGCKHCLLVPRMLQMLTASWRAYAAGVVTTLREARATQAIKLAAIKVNLAQRVINITAMPAMFPTGCRSSRWKPHKTASRPDHLLYDYLLDESRHFSTLNTGLFVMPACKGMQPCPAALL